MHIVNDTQLNKTTSHVKKFDYIAWVFVFGTRLSLSWSVLALCG